MKTIADFVEKYKSQLVDLKAQFLRLKDKSGPAADRLARELFVFSVQTEELMNYAGPDNKAKLVELRRSAEGLIRALKGKGDLTIVEDDYSDLVPIPADQNIDQLEIEFIRMQERLAQLRHSFESASDRKNPFLLAQLRGKAHSLLEQAEDYAHDKFGKMPDVHDEFRQKYLAPFHQFKNGLYAEDLPEPGISVIKGGLEGWRR